jgi:DNA-binding MarR family transcriptional regulator
MDDERAPSLRRSTAYLLSLTGREARARAADALAERDLRLGHLAALASLEDFGPSSQRELAARLRQDPSDVVTLLDELEQRRLIKRERDAADRRRHRVAITAPGRRTLTRGLGAVRDAERDLLAALTAEQRAQLHEILDALLTAVDGA